MTDSSTVASLGAALAPRYLLERELGRGGMATVYLARDLHLNRAVALKVLLPELGASLGQERFQREIHLAARLSHPNILTVFDSGEAGGRLWYAMPLVEGESLRQRLRRESQLSTSEALRVAGQVAGALAHAHGKGIVHRDIKPENILLAGDQVLVADFGIAKALDASSAEKLTETGLSLGTPAYMSPEQGSGGAVDARSDVYALGCVLYEMLAGAPPFTGPTAQAILARHAVDPLPPLRTVRGTIPEAVERAVERALAKVPADRFATATAFAEALVAVDAPKATRRRRLSARSAKLVLAIIAVTAAVGFGARAVKQRSTPMVVPSAARIAVLPLVSIAADTGLIRLGRDLAVTISASLDGVGGIETADRLSVANATTDRPNLSPGDGAALARRLGATSILRGTLVRAGDNVRLDLGLYETEGLEPLAEGITLSNHRDSIGPLTDSVTWALLPRVWRRGEPPSPSLAAVTTRSLPALRSFLEGERAVAASRWEDAQLAFRSAIAADSTFWLAYSRYALAQWWWDLGKVEPEILDVLRRHQGQLPERERLVNEAFLTSLDSLNLRVERHRLVTERFPEYWPGWFLYGDALYHYGSERGHEWTEAVQAFQQAIARNPKLVAAWVHILDATLGKDQAEAAKAAARLAELGYGSSDSLYRRFLLGIDRAGGAIPPELGNLAGSLAGRVASLAEARLQAGYLGSTVLLNGFPTAQIQLNDRTLEFERLSPQVRAALQAANAWAWAARGRWDSALAIMDRVAQDHPGVLGPPKAPIPGSIHMSLPPLALQSYELAVIGTWLGATAADSAVPRRALAVSTVAEIADEQNRREALCRLAWLDGILGFARGDRKALQAARRQAIRSGYYMAETVDRSLETFEDALAGKRESAGEALADLDSACIDRSSCSPITPSMAVQRLAAAQWLAETGHTERARRLLRWIDAEGTWIPPVFTTLFNTLGAPTYLARARLEGAHGDPRRAREYYRQFLRRYDQPMPSLAHLVEEAKAALARPGMDR